MLKAFRSLPLRRLTTSAAARFLQQTAWEKAVGRGEKLVQKTVLSPSELLGDDIKLMRQHIQKLLGSGHPVLTTISNYYFRQKGKHIRPLLVLLVAHATLTRASAVDIDAPISRSTTLTFRSTYPPSAILNTQRRLAEIVEMIHTASLLHDDVIDVSATRRNQPTANHEFGNKCAILAGDFLLARASVALSRLHNHEVVELIANTIADLVEGEFMQLRNSHTKFVRLHGQDKWDAYFDYYLQKTCLKTASLISKSCRASAVLGGASSHVADAAHDFGQNLGIAFQLIDDRLDFVVSQKEFGKPVNADLQLGLATAPVLYAVQEYPELWELIDRKFSQDGDVEMAKELVTSSRGLDRTLELAQDYAAKALECLSVFPESPAIDVLVALTHSVTDRKK